MEDKINIWKKAKIKNMELKNRIVRSATNEHLGTLDGCITDDYIKVYANLAQNGVGLIITSHMAIDKNQRADVTHICVNDSKNQEKLKLLTETVHKYGSKIIAQVSYCGHHGSKMKGQICKTPSGKGNTKALSKENIEQCIINHVKTIKTLQKTGFDGVQLHMAYGYLLSEFLDPFYNERTDDYGGNANNRYRIIHEILMQVNQIIEPNFAIIAKIDSVSKNKDKDFMDQQIEICKWLEKDGVDAIEISGSNFKELNQTTPYFLDNALRIKGNVNLPIILVGGFRNVCQMNDTLEKGIDFISMSRPFIAEENFVQKLKNNQESICTNCNSCFEIYKTQHKRCILRNDIVHQLEINFPNINS